uniref:Uncharacterized protein n=1 Tax=Anguilla anguilla TaxID=7936 RepID=A0A0E9XHX1_ANGAN
MSSSEETETEDGTHGPARKRGKIDRADVPCTQLSVYEE